MADSMKLTKFSIEQKIVKKFNHNLDINRTFCFSGIGETGGGKKGK